MAAIPESLSTGPVVLLRPLRLAAMSVGGLTLGQMATRASIHRFASSIALWILFIAIATGARPGARQCQEAVVVVGCDDRWQLRSGSHLFALGLGGRLGRPLRCLHACSPPTLRLVLGATLLLTVAASISLTTGWLPDLIPSRYTDRFLSIGGSELFASRIQECSAGLQAIRTSPLWGYAGAPNPYNMTLAVASRSGVPALLPLMWLVVSALIATLKRRKGEGWIWAAGVGGSIVGLLVTGIGESSLGIRVTPLAMVCFGIAFSLQSTASVSAQIDENSGSAPDPSSKQATKGLARTPPDPRHPLEDAQGSG